MNRIPMLAGNWKMHGTRPDADALARAIAAGVGQVAGREVVLAPPFTALDVVRGALAGTAIGLAAQNMHWEAKGAFTGEISAGMLTDLGCTHVIIGHSERRQYFGETDETVNRKVRAALGAGLVPIVCVGETLAEREAVTTLTVVERQVRGGLDGLDTASVGRCVLAYEPVWAIGTGRTATPAQAEEVHALIRRLLGTIAGSTVAEGVRILYGGSVKADNIDALMAERDIDGALVGGASLEVAAFTRIVQYRE